MKWFIKFLLILLPIVLIVNLYRYFFQSNEYEYYGIKAFFDNISSFPGLTQTIKYITGVGENAVEMVHSNNIFEGIKEFADMCYNFFMIIVGAIEDVISNVIWVLKMIGVV